MRTIARYTRVLRHRFPEVLDVRVEKLDLGTGLVLKLPNKQRVGFCMSGTGPRANNALFDKAERWLCKEFRNGKATSPLLQAHR